MNYLDEAALEVINKSVDKIGGPFGAVIVKDDKIISKAVNSVLRDNDPTAHAEINAIRSACQKLGTYDLANCVIYTTSEPCPMCLSAIIWANIKTIYFSTNRKQVAEIGFRDDFIYEYIKSPNNEINKIQLDNNKCIQILKEYNNKIY